MPEPNLRALWEHEIRWTSTIRALAPVSLCGSTLQYPLFWSLLAILFSGGAPWSLVLFVAGWMGRWVATGMIDGALQVMGKAGANQIKHVDNALATATGGSTQFFVVSALGADHV